jgi:hypothetical protein
VKSRLADELRAATRDADLRLTPEQRLEAWAVHCRLVVELAEAGRKVLRIEDANRHESEKAR